MSVFLVTGSSRGLGRDIVRTALEAGHQVVATARRADSLADLVQAFGPSIHPVALDVTDPAAAERAVHVAVEAFGRLDVVVNNAGYADIAAIEDVSLDAFRAQIETNLFGVVNVTKAALPVLREQGSGHVIIVSSVGGRLTTPGLGAYQAAKWALGGFGGVLAKEVAPLGIHVTVLEPGGMATDWAGSSMEVPPISAPYEQTVGVSARMHETEIAGNAASDPALVANVVLEVAGMDAPPLRLLLGSDAYDYTRADHAALGASDEKWERLSRSTTRPNADTGALDPLART